MCSAPVPFAARKYFWHAKGGVGPLLIDLLQRSDLNEHWKLPDPAVTASARRARELGVSQESCLYDSWGWKIMVNDSGFINDMAGRENIVIRLTEDGVSVLPKNTNYSVGTWVLDVLNFPEHVRKQPQNMLVWGLTPGRDEDGDIRQPKNLQNILRLLVDELLHLWSTGLLDIGGNRRKVMLLLVAADSKGLCFFILSAHVVHIKLIFW